MRLLKKEIIVLVLICVAGLQSYAQDINVSKVQNKAEKLFQLRNYASALPLFLQLETAGAETEHLDYKIAKCLIASDEINNRANAAGYFEQIDVSSFKELPRDYYKDFGDAYMYNEQVEQALIMYDKMLSSAGTDRREKSKAQKRIDWAKNAYSLMRIPKNVKIERLGESINSEFIEYNPVVSADERVMAYTALRPAESKTGEKMKEDILISHNETGSWSMPQVVQVQTPNNYGTAGISADGQEMIIFIGDQSNGSLYKIHKDGNAWTRPIPIDGGVQSKYMESTASVTPDGKVIYFASNRPGGYGGMDIYKSTRSEDGIWGRAENLGPEINTKANEDAPFIHPNNQLLFFTTDGHNGMGGNDIYKSEFKNGQWDTPKNMGYPINTTANDNYFTLIADGSRGYFSSDRKGGMGGQDLYVMDMPEDYETIPLTMIKGKILDADTQKPMKTKIFMIDTETKEKLDYVYNPDPKTGDYLVILPPNKSYDMIIESEGFLPYTLNIDVPNQTEFYELYQKIFLKTIKHFDVVVGQQVEVKNAFYNTQQEEVETLRKEHEATLIDRDSIDVYELMSDLIEAGDQEAIDYLVGLMMIKTPIDDVDFKDENDKVQMATRTYYYDESDESKFEKKNVDGEVIYSLPTMFVTKEAEAQRMKTGRAFVAYDPALLSKVLKVYFDAGKSDFDAKYEQNLDEILEILNNNHDLGIEISGYASAEGDEEFNKKLSNHRAISVLDYVNKRGIVRRRIIAKGYGSTNAQGSSKAESRRVEVRIVDLNTVQ